MLKKLILDSLPRHRANAFVKRLDRMACRFHQAYENLDYDFHRNGENAVLERVAAIFPRAVVFDVGANTGEWATLASGMLPEGTIHSFEIVPSTHAQLLENTRHCGNVIANGIGLAEAPGEVPVFFTPDRSANATCVPGISEAFHKYDPERADVPVTTGDAYCREHDVARIDFLKMDVEGLEPRVLAGFHGMLADGRIGAIQFEYGYVNIQVKFLLMDFYTLLEPLGFQIGKIFPDHVDFKAYELFDENFFGPNYLAVHESQPALLQALAGPAG